jgi:hypothetical protein
MGNRTDLTFMPKPSIWEKPRNIVALLTAVSMIAGIVGFEPGRHEPPPQQPVINVYQPVIR